MKKTTLFGRISALFLLIATLFTFSACNIIHKHVYEDHLIKNPTCTEMGIIKSLCIECGDTKYSEIQTLPHKYFEGICTECGASESAKKALTSIPIPTDANNEGMWSFDKIYQTALTVGCAVSYDDFLGVLSGASLKNASINMFGAFNLTVTVPLANGEIFETPISITIDKVSPKNPDNSVGYLLRADVEGNEIIFTYTTGEQISAGKTFSSIEKTITGFGINNDRELVIYYSDSTIAFAGKFST